MMRKSLPLILSTSLLVPAGYSSASPSNTKLVEFKQAIRKLYDMKEHAWAAGDAKTLVEKFYAPDAVEVGEGEAQPTIGKDQLLAAYKQYVKDVTAVRIESVRTYVNGAAGWDWANFYFTPKPDKAAEHPASPVRILLLWSKKNGHWLCEGGMFITGKFPGPI